VRTVLRGSTHYTHIYMLSMNSKFNVKHYYASCIA